MTDSPATPLAAPPPPGGPDPAPTGRGLARWAPPALAAAVLVPLLAWWTGFWQAGTALLVMLALVGTVLLIGRRERTPGDGGTTQGLMAPPVLLLLTVSAATVGATLTWFLTGDGVGPVGAVLAAALVVLGVGQMVGAFRGRSLLLFPLGILVAIPLVMAAAGGQRLQLGSDDPGRIDGTQGETIVLGAGSRPVVIPAATAPRRLTIRKIAGTVEVRIDSRVPVDLTVVGRGQVLRAGGTPIDDDSTMSRRHLVMGGSSAGDPLVLRVEAGFGRAIVYHGFPSVAEGRAEVVSQERAQRYQIVIDIRARRRLLAREQATLARLRALYAARLGRVRSASPAVPPAVLRVQDDRWTQATADGAWPGTLDPALAALTTLRRTRYDLLRAAWRVNSVRTGIATRQRDLRAVDAVIKENTP